MKLKSESHESLYMLFKRNGVPPNIVDNNSKEQYLVKFSSKCREYDCHLVNTDPYSPWIMAAKGCIKQINQGSSQKMLKSKIPKRLWDHCIALKVLIRSDTALYIYGLEDHVP